MEERAVATSLRVAMTISAALLVGCGATAVESVSPGSVIVTNHSKALALSGNQSINGTYTSCTSHVDGDPWVVKVNGAPVTDLSVVKGNTDCVLTVTSLVVNDVAYAAGSPIALTTAYGTASEFHTPAHDAVPDGPVAFYANAKVSSVAFAGNFVVTVLYSDDASTGGTSSNTASYAVQTATSVMTGVPPPDYTIDMTTNLHVQTNNAKVVQSASGTADLTDGLVTGQGYVVLSSLADTTYGEIDAAYKAVVTPTAIAGADPQIAAADFSLGAVDLSAPAVRYVIIANTSNGVPSYQVLTITFNSP